MSLRVYPTRAQIPEGMKVYDDVEYLFLLVPFKSNAYVRKAFKEIDGGEIIDDVSGISRITGCTMVLSDMSTGCKAACCVPIADGVVSLLEVGVNARDFILVNCTEGAVVLDRRPCCVTGTHYDYDEISKVDVMFGSHHVTDLEELDALLEGEMFDHDDWYES